MITDATAHIIGHAVDKPKEIGSKGAIVFTLGVNFSDDTSSFYDIIASQKTAEIVKSWIKKGTPVYVRGSLRIQDSEKDGRKYRNVRIFPQFVSVISGSKTQQTKVPADDFDDDIPF